MVEADRGTEEHRRFLRKLTAFWQWHRQKGHERLLNIDAFRVLTVTNSAVRAANLTELAKMADGRRKGSPMFLFTHDTEFSLEEPGNILGPIWTTPADAQQHSLLD